MSQSLAVVGTNGSQNAQTFTISTTFPYANASNNSYQSGNGLYNGFYIAYNSSRNIFSLFYQPTTPNGNAPTGNPPQYEQTLAVTPSLSSKLTSYTFENVFLQITPNTFQTLILQNVSVILTFYSIVQGDLVNTNLQTADLVGVSIPGQTFTQQSGFYKTSLTATETLLYSVNVTVSNSVVYQPALSANQTYTLNLDSISNYVLLLSYSYQITSQTLIGSESNDTLTPATNYSVASSICFVNNSYIFQPYTSSVPLTYLSLVSAAQSSVYNTSLQGFYYTGSTSLSTSNFSIWVLFGNGINATNSNNFNMPGFNITSISTITDGTQTSGYIFYQFNTTSTTVPYFYLGVAPQYPSS